MIKIVNWLKGKKSYLIGVGVIGFGLYNHYFGEQLSWLETMEFVFGGAGFMTVRAALAKVGIQK